MANEILNKIGHQAKALHPECRTIAIDWGPWEGGMVTPEIKQLFEKRGISVIPYEAGAQLLANELGAPTDSAAQIVVGTPFTAPPARIERTQARKHTVRRVLKESDNPFLADHMIGQHAVLPTVCAVAWFANTAEQLYPGYKMFRCEKFKVLKGIVFDEGLAGEYRLDLDEAEPAAGGELAFRGMIASMSAAGHKRPHYSGVFHLRSQPAEPVFTSLEGLASHPEVAGAETLYSDGTLFHGPSFRGVRRILQLDRNRLVVECSTPRVPEERQGQFRVQNFNPFVADAQFQVFLIWVRKFYDAGSLPLSTELGEHLHSIGFDETYYVILDVQRSSETSMVANLITVNAKGQVCTRLEGAEVTISKALNPLFART